MKVSEQEAAGLVRLMLEMLQSRAAMDVIAGVEESRQLGVEESFALGAFSKADVREVGTIRRRPHTDTEMLRLIFERLHQRLTVIPAIASALRARLAEQIEWRVDTEFVSSERTSIMQARIDDLSPDGLADVVRALEKLRELVPDLAPTRSTNG